MARLSRVEAAEIIERFISGKGDDYEWDDFTSVPYDDPLLDKIVRECIEIHERFPPDSGRQYCNDRGSQRLAELADQLRQSAPQVASDLSSRNRPRAFRPKLLILAAVGRVTTAIVVTLGIPIDRVQSLRIENQIDRPIEVLFWLDDDTHIVSTQRVGPRSTIDVPLSFDGSLLRENLSFPNDFGFTAIVSGTDERLELTPQPFKRMKGYRPRLLIEDSAIVLDLVREES